MEKIMKRILCLILALTLCLGTALTLSSCKNEERDIFALAKELDPTKAVSFIEYTTASGDKLGGEFTLQTDGENAIFTYVYERYRTTDEMIEEDTAERIKEISGTVYRKDGKYSEDGKTWGSSPIPSELKINLDRDKLTNTVLSEDGNELTAEITAENIEAVLGTKLEIEGNATLIATANSVYLTGITVSCTTKTGSVLVIRTSYSYNEISLVFPTM